MFGEHWNVLLPSYLTEESKGRLQDALTQFHPENRNEIIYDDFYKNYGHSYFLQGDIVLDLRIATWDSENKRYEKTYTDALIVSNTCDISVGNNRSINPKQCLFAPLIDLEIYKADLLESGFTEQQIDQFVKTLKAQCFSNIFYLPAGNGNDKERIALFDRLFWFPIDELEPLIDTIDEERITSLHQYGFYLLVFKLSYHLCRIPEQCDREVA